MQKQPRRKNRARGSWPFWRHWVGFSCAGGEMAELARKSGDGERIKAAEEDLRILHEKRKHGAGNL
ncbi:MAG: hypothetical protein LBO00_07955 [Zoogloeaceae bacterium]|nr:hypothetical protein [Zoogloeaceae bacterium]